MIEIDLFHSGSRIAVQPGQALFQPGDPADVMYAVLEGSVEVRLGDRLLETTGPGGILGELGLVDNSPRSAAASGGPQGAVVTPVDRNRFIFMVQEHPTFALQVMAVLAERLRRVNAAS